MREGFDKEIDSLLRRTARAHAGARGNGAGNAKPDTHLDADELAAFAEGALPEAARLNAVSHLADCGECRSLAVNLTSAAGVGAKLEKHAVAAAASPARESAAKRSWLAAIFAPRTLRYVAPALAVCVVAVVSFIALRSRSGNGLVSLRDSGSQTASPAIATSQNNSQPSAEGVMNSNASANMNTAATAAGAAGPTLDDKSATGAHAPEFGNKKDVGADAPDGSAPVSNVESKASGEVAAAQPPAPAKEEDAAADAPAPREAAKAAPVMEAPAPKSGDNMKAGPPPAQANDDFAYNNESQRAAQKRGLEPQAPDGGARQRSPANNASGGGALASTPRDDKDARSRRAENAPGARRGGRSDQGTTTDGADRESTSEESRAVAGHRFRRARGAWVDVNYKQSMSSTGVRRGTDAYRALVADIPEIGRVVEQLGGEVIVVVRGRAYNIR